MTTPTSNSLLPARVLRELAAIGFLFAVVNVGLGLTYLAGDGSEHDAQAFGAHLAAGGAYAILGVLLRGVSKAAAITLFALPFIDTLLVLLLVDSGGLGFAVSRGIFGLILLRVMNRDANQARAAQ